jgi:hypothetical protein
MRTEEKDRHDAFGPRPHRSVWALADTVVLRVSVISMRVEPKVPLAPQGPRLSGPKSYCQRASFVGYEFLGIGEHERRNE